MPSKNHPVSKTLKRPAGLDENFWKKLNFLTVAMINLVERNSPDKITKIPGWHPFLLVATRATRFIYESILYLSADSPVDSSRKLEYGICTSPLIRSLADLLFSIIFIREKPRSRIIRYHQAGWKETKEILEVMETRYASDPNWKERFTARNTVLEDLRIAYKIPPQKAKNLKNIPYWPIPSKILQNEKLKVRTKNFLDFLILWYRELSQDHHMSGGGIIRVYSKLLFEADDMDKVRVLKELKTGNVMLAVTLVLAISTEINDIGSFDRAENLAYLWGILLHNRSEAQELYDIRYRTILKKNGAGLFPN